MLARDPCLWEAWSPFPTAPPTKHRSCLMCPIELHSVTLDAVVPGTNVRTFAEAPVPSPRQGWRGWRVEGTSRRNLAPQTRPGRCCRKHTGSFLPVVTV